MSRLLKGYIVGHSAHLLSWNVSQFEVGERQEVDEWYVQLALPSNILPFSLALFEYSDAKEAVNCVSSDLQHAASC